MPLALVDGPDDYWTKTTSPDGAHVWVVSPPVGEQPFGALLRWLEAFPKN